MATDDPPPQNTTSTTLDIKHPFFLGTDDRPDDYITPTELRFDNYEHLAEDLQLAFQARRKFGFLDGSITGPIEPYIEADWLTVNSMIVS